MPTNNRVQLSLIINDRKLMDELINPYKDVKELTPLVIKLLSAYFYSDEVRNLVDSYGVDGNSGVEHEKMQEYFNSIKQNLAMLSIMEDNLTETLNTGLNSVVKTSYSMSEEEMKDWGKPVPSLEFPSEAQPKQLMQQSEITTKESVVIPVVDSVTEKRLSSLESSVNKILSLLENTKSVGVEESGVTIEESVASVVKSEAISLQDEIKTLQSNNELSNVENKVVIEDTLSSESLVTPSVVVDTGTVESVSDALTGDNENSASKQKLNKLIKSLKK